MGLGTSHLPITGLTERRCLEDRQAWHRAAESCVLDAPCRIRQSTIPDHHLSSAMTNNRKAARYDLRRIAHDAMLQRGLLPDFSAAVLAETERDHRRRDGVRRRRSATCAHCSGRRSTTTTRAISISSRSREAAGRRRGRGSCVAIADVDALVQEGLARSTTTRAPTRRRSTRRREIFPMLPEKLSTDLTSLNEGEDRLAVVVEMTVAADGTVADVRRLPRASSATTPSSPTTASRPGSTATAPAPAPLAAVPGLDEQLRAAGPRRAGACERVRAGARRAAPRDASRRGRSSTATRSPTCAPTRRTAPRS